jgi:hypothetical protein
VSASTERLIGELVQELRPVRRIASPWWRAGLFVALVALAAAVLAARADLPAVAARLGSAPDMWLAVVGSVATTVLAAVAACMASVPGRSRRWALLPLPAVALWLGASGLGCLRGTALAVLHKATMADAMHDCMPFILRTSVLLAVPMAALLWWARPLRPGLVSILGGLAVAAGSASLLWLFHPFDASAADLAAHTVAVLAVLVLCRVVALAGRLRPRR